MKLTSLLIAQLAYPGMPTVLVDTWATKLGAVCEDADINTPQRLSHFLAQVTHESGGFKYMVEIWGPTPAQVRYEGRLDLGNTELGDGFRYRGRGPMMLTGRGNFRIVGQRIGYPLEQQPELASQIGVGSLVACDYWNAKRLNALADLGGLTMVPAITRIVNGGLNNLDDRQRRYRLAAKALGLA
ncbi:glycoside hydrolase family 19 protein [Deinococcus ruber]|uniref:Lysozyme n=1 Tax=Deinococcus ruber TaxID=1848197 RepID=A0A918CC47_9DEIO|nr:glycoside hydrolase family 19 protein [Deinococcus ruber]GGR16988.1 lysozyme [Deinococcus ruber]